ncbi:EamA family transporter [Actinomyces trachealis]|uniref:EamA family transporter n=1 Tax=Actinomyces trachealis TaxID=2763540 RepID=UPI001FD0429C|nr:hypothetical protein [Actinomyces trachealis]
MSTAEPPSPTASTIQPTPLPGHPEPQNQQDASGMVMVLGCYLLWGFFPLYFKLLAPTGAVEIIGHRIVWTLVTCLVLVALRRSWARLGRVLGRPRRAQFLSILLATAGVGVMVVLQGSVPWVSLGLALSFGLYRLAKKSVGGRVDPLSGLTVESLVVSPFALGYLAWLWARRRLRGRRQGAGWCCCWCWRAR